MCINRNGSTNIAYDLPPPAEPPYNTSCSGAARKSVWGPMFGLNTILSFSSSMSFLTGLGKVSSLSSSITKPFFVSLFVSAFCTTFRVSFLSRSLLVLFSKFFFNLAISFSLALTAFLEASLALWAML